MTKERKRILIVGALLLLAGAIYRFSPSLGALPADDTAINLKLQRIAKYQVKIKSEKQLQKKIVALTRQLERAERIFLEGATPALAAVHIQNIINEIAYKNELTIDSLTVKKTIALDDVDGVMEVPVQVKIQATIRQLSNLLYKLESGPQLLSITEMQIRRATRGDDNRLYAYLTISGYMRET